MLTAEKFLSGLVKIYGKRPVSTDGGTWYPQECKFLKLTYRIHSPHGKRLIEWTMRHIKDRTEGFDCCFPCRMARRNLHHVKNWLNLFAIMHNKKAINA
jgi:putative transposase